MLLEFYLLAGRSTCHWQRTIGAGMKETRIKLAAPCQLAGSRSSRRASSLSSLARLVCRLCALSVSLSAARSTAAVRQKERERSWRLRPSYRRGCMATTGCRCCSWRRRCWRCCCCSSNLLSQALCRRLIVGWLMASLWQTRRAANKRWRWCKYRSSVSHTANTAQSLLICLSVCRSLVAD